MRGDQARRRGGFTLIEIVAVLAVISLLACLLIPAAMGSREAARRAQCINNLKQIGLALSNRAAQHGRFPAGIVPDSSAGSPSISSASSLSPQVQLLPFLEQAALYDSINLAIPQRVTDHPSNATAIGIVVESFLCPSDPTGVAPGNSYRACVGPYPYEMDRLGPPPGGGGAFPGLREVAPAGFTDGLSQTAGFSEHLRGRGQRRFDPARDVWFSGISQVQTISGSDQLMTACGHLQSPSPADTWTQSGRWWCVGRYADTLYNHVVPPNWAHADCSAESTFGRPGDISGGAVAARSGHPGGVHLLMMDGSARFVREHVNLALWRALASRSDGEPIGGLP